MPRPCSICTHEKRSKIDKAIVDMVSYRNIGAQYNVSYGSVKRHVDRGHVLTKIKKAAEIKEVKEALTFDDYVTELNEKDRDSFLVSHQSGSPKEKAEATKTRIGTLTLYGKYTGALIERKEISGPEGGPIEITRMPDDELELRAKQILSRRAGNTN